jgi:hypothetical protein
VAACTTTGSTIARPMKCPVCGDWNEPDARYCIRCGSALESTIEFLPRPLEGFPRGDHPKTSTPSLRVVTGPLAGSLCALNETITTIGRDPSNDLFLDDVSVSRRHAEIVGTPDGFRVRDLGSLNGTYVDGVREEEKLLRDGAHLRIGRYDVVFHG